MASSSSTSWTRCAAPRRRTAPTCRARACSAICCRWSKARLSTRVTARCGPITFCSSRPGRFTIRVELTDLNRADFLRILTEPKHALTKQYVELLATEGVKLTFTPDGIEALADFAFEVNRTTQNIGARRLHTILERVVEEISYEGPDLANKNVVIDGGYVRGRLAEILQKEDLSRFIL